jgi:hypothetical protein
VVAEGLAGRAQGAARADGRHDADLDALDVFGGPGDPLCLSGGDGDYAVRVGAYEGARADLDTRYSDRLTDGRQSDAILAGPHEAAAAEQRVVLREAGRHIAADATDYRADDAAGRSGQAGVPHRLWQRDSGAYLHLDRGLAFGQALRDVEDLGGALAGDEHDPVLVGHYPGLCHE